MGYGAEPTCGVCPWGRGLKGNTVLPALGTCAHSLSVRVTGGRSRFRQPAKFTQTPKLSNESLFQPVIQEGGYWLVPVVHLILIVLVA